MKRLQLYQVSVTILMFEKSSTTLLSTVHFLKDLGLYAVYGIISGVVLLCVTITLTTTSETHIHHNYEFISKCHVQKGVLDKQSALRTDKSGVILDVGWNLRSTLSPNQNIL